MERWLQFFVKILLCGNFLFLIVGPEIHLRQCTFLQHIFIYCHFGEKQDTSTHLLSLWRKARCFYPSIVTLEKSKRSLDLSMGILTTRAKVAQYFGSGRSWPFLDEVLFTWVNMTPWQNMASTRNIPPFLKVWSLNVVFDHQVHIKNWRPPANIPTFWDIPPSHKLIFGVSSKEMTVHGMILTWADHLWKD